MSRSTEVEPRSSFWQSLRQWFRPRQDSSLKDVIEDVIEEHEEQAEEPLAPEEKRMLHNVLSFGDLTVRDIMIPRTDIAAVPTDIALVELKAHITLQRHTRIPLYEGTLDHMKGFLHLKDLIPMLSGDVPYHLSAVARALLFVPGSMPLMDLLVKMRHSGSHMAIVVDEHGGTDGLVTMEDVFEELVGDIQDEHDDEEDSSARMIKVGEHAYEMNARIRIDKLEQKLGLNLKNEDIEGEYDTLGGLIFFQLGRVPDTGEIIDYQNGIKFQILEADPRRIHKVRLVTAG